METLSFKSDFLRGCYFPEIKRSTSCTRYQISSGLQQVVEVFSTDEFSLLFTGGKSFKVNRDRRYFKKHVHTIIDLDSDELIGEIEVKREEGFVYLYDGRNFHFSRGFGLNIRIPSTWFRNYFDVFELNRMIGRFDIKKGVGSLEVADVSDLMNIATSLFVMDEIERLRIEHET